ncbi:GTP cyclohydrolase 1 [Striga asiatica]|uniref:GTP cyclohydrolase 1 n=1 Tax=Striga asiatica TaxID=4170 RepID=A0A5A7RIH3_STRAF|nr:GTP cyclohydrolase 1 [Striga asiatica]
MARTATRQYIVKSKPKGVENEENKIPTSQSEKGEGSLDKDRKSCLAPDKEGELESSNKIVKRVEPVAMVGIGEVVETAKQVLEEPENREEVLTQGDNNKGGWNSCVLWYLADGGRNEGRERMKKTIKHGWRQHEGKKMRVEKELSQMLLVTHSIPGPKRPRT